jgi:hypothetical protein
VECLLIHLLGQWHVTFGAKLVQESVPERSSDGTWRGHQLLSADSLPNLTVVAEKKLPELSHRTLEAQTVQEACESDAQSSAESVCSNKQASSYPTLLRSERSPNSRATSLETYFDEPDSSWYAAVANSGSVLSEESDNVNEETAANHDASHRVAVAGSKLRALSNSDPNLLCSREIGSAGKRQSALFERPRVSGRALPLSGSDPSLVPSHENGKSRKGNGFTLVKLKSKVLGWKSDCGTIFSAFPSSLPTRNSSHQSRYKHVCKAGESREKLRGEKEIFKAPKLHHAMDRANQDCVAHVAVETPSPAVIPRSRGAAQMRSVTPQEQEEATNEQFLYDIEWSFPESGKRSCGHIAKFALASPLSGDRQRLPHLSRPRSGPVRICKSLQQLCVLWLHTVVSGRFVVMCAEAWQCLQIVRCCRWPVL